MSNLPVSNGNDTKQQSFKHPVGLWDAMDDFMDRFVNYMPFKTAHPSTMSAKGFKLNPSVDIVENDKAFTLTAELPGLELNDVKLEVHDGTLTLSGEKKAQSDHKDTDNYHVMERSYGYFSRSFTLPGSVDPEGIEANFSKGIVTITLPKSEQAQQRQRKIPINET